MAIDDDDDDGGWKINWEILFFHALMIKQIHADELQPCNIILVLNVKSTSNINPQIFHQKKSWIKFQRKYQGENEKIDLLLYLYDTETYVLYQRVINEHIHSHIFPQPAFYCGCFLQPLYYRFTQTPSSYPFERVYFARSSSSWKIALIEERKSERKFSEKRERRECH